MTLKVEDLMYKGDQIPLCHPNDKVFDVLVELSNKRCGCLLVRDNESRLLGIFTDGDLRRSIQNFGMQVFEKRIEELMTRSAKFVSKNLLAWEAIQLMQTPPNHWITVMPVVEDEKIVGVIRMHDIIHAGI